MKPTLNLSLGRTAVRVFFVVCAGLPIAGSLAYAACSVGLAGLLSHGFTLDYWRQARADREIAAAFAMSGYVATAVTILTVGIALTLALSLRQSLRRGLLATFIYYRSRCRARWRCARSNG